MALTASLPAIILNRMVKQTQKLDNLFYALSDKTRRGIIAQLSHKQLMARELAKPYPMSLPAISKHLRILEKARLIDRTIQGRTHLFRLNHNALKSASEWIVLHQKFWQESLAKLELFLKNNKQ
jgi:DNA-binding transcriptional ArsR family regulator